MKRHEVEVSTRICSSYVFFTEDDEDPYDQFQEDDATCTDENVVDWSMDVIGTTDAPNEKGPEIPQATIGEL